MEIGEVLSVNQQVEHVETLATNLKTSFHPVDGSLLEELGLLQRSKQVLVVLRLGLLLVQVVEDKVLEQLLVRNADLDGWPVCGRSGTG